MSEYSEMMGSFVRTGNYPLEANYIFDSEAALKEFFDDPIRKTTLHKGLLKIVANGDDQTLYWVTKKKDSEDLEFTILLQANSIEDLNTQIADLLTKLNKEIEDRTNADKEIWGTEDKTELAENLGNLKEISLAVKALQDRITTDEGNVNTLKDQLKATVGTTSDDIIAYLKTLPYESLTKAAEALDKWLNQKDAADNKINTLPELQDFLNGYTDQDTLTKILDDLWNKIEGDPLPTEEFRTIRGIEDFIRTFKRWAEDRTNNLQTELDQTQVGVGLSGDGGYNADQETNYLKQATSVMNALKILDGLLKTAIDTKLKTKNTDVIDLTIDPDSNTISGLLVLSPKEGNQLSKEVDGLYYNAKIDYDAGTVTFKVNDNIISQFNIAIKSVVSEAKYDPTTEEIIITFNTQEGPQQIVKIPVGALIREWEPDNSGPSDTVVLTRTEVVNGPDKLSADVRLKVDKYNILTKVDNTLYVKGTADNLTYRDQNLQDVLDKALQTIDSLFTLTNVQISPSTAYDGQTTDVTLSWDYIGIPNNITPDTIFINGQSIDSKLKTYTFKGVNKTTTYTITASYGNKVSTAQVTITFLESVLLGVDNADLANADNLAIYQSKPIRLDCTGGKYLYFAKKTGGNSNVTLNGLVLDDFTSKAVTYHDMEYTLYKSNNKYNGIIILNVI